MKSFNRYLPLLAISFVIAVNAAANIIPINGYATGQLSDLNPTGFTPAGWVFAIWSLIYLGLLAYACVSAFGSEAIRVRAASIRTLFLCNAAVNVAWIFAWHYRQVELSFVIMLGILGTLIAINEKLMRRPPPSLGELLFVDAPFSLYFGWITTATIANLGAFFFAQQFYPFALSMDQWALVSVVAAVGIYAWRGVVTGDIVYCAVFIWASMGIFYKPTDITDPVKIAAITGTALLSAIVIWLAARKLFLVAREEALTH
jgi:benzodiazapine receptor